MVQSRASFCLTGIGSSLTPLARVVVLASYRDATHATRRMDAQLERRNDPGNGADSGELGATPEMIFAGVRSTDPDDARAAPDQAGDGPDSVHERAD